MAVDREIEVAPGVRFAAWTYNGRIPGPTLRCREGERLRITLVNGSTHPHTIHFHGIHPAAMDGVPGLGAGEIAPGERTTYEFDALPAGLHLYHCHVRPLAEHIAKGLYGAFIIDPKEPREDADELVMVMNGFDTNFDRANELYAANTIPFAYMNQPIPVRTGQLVRLYLVNVLEYDLINSFHLHGNLFDWYPTGTSRTASEFTDTVMLCQGQRGIAEWRFRRGRALHVPRPPVGVHRARLAGLLRGRRLMGTAVERAPAWLLGLVPLLLVAAAAAAFAAFGAPGLGDRRGPPAEELAVERTLLRPGTIELTVRNDGPDAVSVAQVIVNDAFAQFSGAEGPIGRLQTAKLRVSQPWVEGEAYEVALLTSAGGTIVHEIPVAVATPTSDLSFYGLMALLGIYVGVIPIALGMLWLPWIRRIPPGGLRAVMALSVGLLAFLAVDATLEGLELAGEGSQALGGALLVFAGAGVAYLALAGGTAWLARRQRAAEAAGASGATLALLVATGIGLHNLGEGVAIGAAYSAGALALGAFLVIGFALHNTTEGLAIVAPIAGDRPTLRRLALLGVLAGAPAVTGAWIGAAAFNASLAAFLFGFGAGAIVQVIVQLAPSLARRRGPHAASDGRLRHPGRHGDHVRYRAAGGRLMAAAHELRPSEAIQDYAKAIYALQQRSGGDPVATNDLAERLSVTPASVSAMLKKLAERGLVEHVPYKGVALTMHGRRVALEVLRHHRLLELYLAEHLGVPWDRVHEEAEALEHVISEELEARIAAKLGEPTHDPHGDPIPDAELRIDEGDTQPLSALEPGEAGRFVRVSDSNPDMLRYLDERGVRLGDTLEIVDRQPFGGPLTVRFGDHLHTLGGELVRAMRVELAGR